jgi:glutaminyl-tRNA synthetase
MKDNNKIKKTNFIKNIIEKDLDNKIYKSIKTRFPPEPNGYLHIGHAKSICLNFGIVKKYKGKCNLRFDDTNPTKENIQFVNYIKDDIKWLGFKWDKNVKYSSNYFNDFYKYAIELVKKDLAYVCFLNTEQIRKYRGTLKQKGKNSPYRNTPIKENLALLEKMKDGKFNEGECVLRAKIDMESSFICMRDPVIYRIIFAKHHQTAEKWFIYPMYDFAHCISDAIEGVTHSLCTLEFQDNRRLYDWILTNLNDFNKPDRPYQYEFSRLNLEYTIMSKRLLQKLVEDKLVSGWDDPRMPTICGLRRRGYTPNSIIDFTKKNGISKIDSITKMSLLEDSVRDDLNNTAPRVMAVINPIKVIITNYLENKVESIEVLNHLKNENMGKRQIFFSKEIYIDKNDFSKIAPNKKFKRLAINKEVRLRHAYVIKATSFDIDENDNIKTIYATYDADTLGKNPKDGRKIKGVIHFVESTTAIKAEFRIYDRLFKVENPNKSIDFKETINPDSLVIKHGVIESSMLEAKPESSYQFEREGYFCRDNKKSAKLVFNKTVGLKDTWNK